MMTHSLSQDVFRDKVFGCWMGKNSGGTLGAPLEKALGEEEPFDIWWYPRLQEGGIPNDDLELQLICLLALEEVGPTVNANDLVQYWLDYVGYNWDEYGFHKVNLRHGLQPPVSGIHNNWFTDCMGCPIRSEIWACVAPGYPRIAVQYAYEDAIIDHAGGEGLYGELFNTAIQSAAFILSEPKTLLEIGLSYTPESSRTHVAVKAALDAHAAGVDWKEARKRVLRAVPHFNSQYSPLNMAFQVIGWLYGNDFGDAICKAVNCGYDTDCTGATLGAYIGIVDGNSRLPAKWLEPLGTVIATNASWGGLRNLDKGLRSVPKNTVELTDRTLAVSQRVLEHHGVSLDAIPLDVAALKSDEASRAIWKRNPWQLNHRTSAVNVGVEYPKSAALAPGQTRRILTHLENPHPAAIELRVELESTPSLSVANPARVVALAPRSSLALTWDVTAMVPLAPSQRLNLALSVDQRPALPTLPIILLGTTRWRVLGPLPAEGRSDRELYDAVLEPELLHGQPFSPAARTGAWLEVDAELNDIPFLPTFTQVGAVYAQTFTWNPVARQVRIGVPSNAPVKVWLNGQLVTESFVYRPYRPNFDGCGDDRPIAYVNREMPAGWNEILIKCVRGDGPLAPDNAPFTVGLLLADPAELNAGLTDQVRSRLPWD